MPKWFFGAGHILIDYGADISAKDSFGYTPLHWACQNASHFDKGIVIWR